MATPFTITPVAAPVAAPTFGVWTCCPQPAGTITHPDQLSAKGEWMPAEVPGTAAGAMLAAGKWHLGQPYDFDVEDWWFRTSFSSPGVPCHLCCDGLATLAEVWLNGRLLLTTDNMFRHYRVELTPPLRAHNELTLGFRSLNQDLKTKRPRPRWKTNLVSQQQLRWRRTSLLGRIPGWSPPVAPVGPWRNIHLETLPLAVIDTHLSTRLEGDDGVAFFNCRMESAAPILKGRLSLGDHETAISLRRDGNDWLLQAEVHIAQPTLWWPHTHGEQPLYTCKLLVNTAAGEYAIDCGKVGFRRLEMTRDAGFALSVNGMPIYCRGACWTVGDVVQPGSEVSLEGDLRLARAAGINMLRIVGTMVYECDRFYELCDELGILVWQDFMFANMDYPCDDPDFAANIQVEAQEQLARLAPHPSIAVLCGNSEVEQQAAMLGMPRESWSNSWFAERLPELCQKTCPGVRYVPSTPSGGVLPFHVGTGIAHYYGVGAYRRLPAELRKADVKFTPECLGFSNVPEPETVNALMGGSAPVTHHPVWKQRVPRDAGPGWDFEDVRDFYLQHLFAVDPVQLRSFDTYRYMQLSRVVPGEMMSQAFAEWRSFHGHNRGGIVWFYKDLWPGAGWGIVDSFGIPKAAYYYLRRSWQTRQIVITDEGLDGLHLHALNELSEPFRGHVELTLLQDGHITVARGEEVCELPARGRKWLASDALLGGFYDVTYAYRFGPPKHNLAIATLFDDQRRVVSEAFYFVTACVPPYVTDVKVESNIKQIGPGQYEIRLQSDRFLQSVRFDAKGYLPNDNYFHLSPGRPKIVSFRALKDPETRFRPSLEALNLRNPVLVHG
jgi:beta-mannosidase